MKDDIEELTQKVREFSKERNWNQFHTPKELAIALTLEANEVLELFRFKNEFNQESISKEIADVLNLLLLLSDILKIDLVENFNKKLEENAKKYPVEKCYGLNKKYTELN